MKKHFLLILTIILTSFNSVFAQQIPQDIQEYVKKHFENAYFRFDGLVILPDNTVYIPVIPAKFDTTIENLNIKETIPTGKDITKLPDAIIFNNDFVLLKVINDKTGAATLLTQSNYPIEIKSGIIPQDILLPRRLVIPENLSTIKGSLESYNEEIDDIRENTKGTTDYTKTYFNHPALKNSVFYITTPIAKNIKVFSANNKKGYYHYKQKMAPNKMSLYNDKYLLISSYSKRSLSVLSLYDDVIIKEINLKTTPDEIIITGDKAYVSSSEGHCIYVIDLIKMQPTQQILINGMCEKLTLADDEKKLFYYDKQTKTLWAIELDNNYLLKDIGVFPNISKIAYNDGKIYVTSRTKNRIAIIDYIEMNLIGEFDVAEKPVDLFIYNNNVYILSARENKIQILNTETIDFNEEIILPSENGFPSKFYKLKNSNHLLITDTARSAFYLLDLDENKIVLDQFIDEPIANIEIGNIIRKFNDK